MNAVLIPPCGCCASLDPEWQASLYEAGDETEVVAVCTVCYLNHCTDCAV